MGPCATNNGNCDPNATCTPSGTTRTCACKAGFTGDGSACADINECLTDNGGCSANATCTNTPGSRTCACNSGYSGDGTTCADVNECSTANGGCSPNAACTNTPGSRTCACNSGFTGDGITCTDVNECSTANGGCAASATCTNTPGSRTCACNSGYAGDGITCSDINECLTSNGGCSSNASCTNTAGSRICTCNSGYSGDGVTCADINECLTNNGGCSANAACTNTPGSRTCACNSGYTGDGLTCADINECLTNNGGCSANAACTNTPGSRTCACNAGYSGDGVTCTDINECLASNGGCSAYAVCTNTPGSRTCACSANYTGDGLTCVGGYALSFDGVDDGVVSPPLSRGLVSALTAEYWISPSQIGVWMKILNVHNGNNRDVDMEIRPDGKVYCTLFDQAGVNHGSTSTSVLVAGNWYHIACSYDGATQRMFVNGVLETSTSWSGSVQLNDRLNISGFESRYVKAVIDEFRLSSVARYTAGFTPPTALSGDSSTVLLWRFDEGTGSTSADLSNSFTCQLGGGPYQTLQSGITIPANGAPTWVPSSRMKKGIDFDGVDDGVVSPPLGRGLVSAWTAEYWIKPNQIGVWMKILNIHNDNNRDIDMEIRPDGKVYCTLFDQAGVNHGSTSTSVLTAGNWYHIGCSYDGTTQRMFVNGVLETSTAWTGSIQVNDRLNISGFENRYVKATLDEFRMSSTARYTSGFVPPATMTPDSSTVVLWRFDEGAGTTSADLSGNSFTCQLGGGPYQTLQSGITIPANGIPTWVSVNRP
ncbi:MAG: hypothetical protein HYZ28_18645 [Myxococcales bacterium]|nr:hypothetical protein [Myxococcales bacterium]